MSTGIASVPMGNTTGARRRHAAASFKVIWKAVLCERRCIDFSRRGEEDVIEPRACQLDVALHHHGRWCCQRRSPPQSILKPVPPGPAQAAPETIVRQAACMHTRVNTNRQIVHGSAVCAPVGATFGPVANPWGHSVDCVTLRLRSRLVCDPVLPVRYRGRFRQAAYSVRYSGRSRHAASGLPGEM